MSEKYIYKTRIYYEDTDAGGVVYYANYFKFIERARTEMIYKLLGLSHSSLKNNHDCIFLVSGLTAKFLKPIKFEDNIEVFTRILSKSAVRLKLEQIIKKNDELMFKSEVDLAVVNSKGKLSKLDKGLLAKI